MSQETRDAQRVVPWALMASLVICTVLYILVALMVTGLADYRELGVADPVYVALAAAGLRWHGRNSLIGAVVVVGLISALLVTLLGQVRIFYGMSRDGCCRRRLWPSIRDGARRTLERSSLVRERGPHRRRFPLQLLGELISIGTLLAFAIVMSRRDRFASDAGRICRVPSACPVIPGARLRAYWCAWH